MSKRNGRPPGVKPLGGAGAEQLLMESVACLVLRGDVDHIVIGPEERWLLYELFPKGFGLVAFEDPQTHAIKLSLVGEDGLPVLVDMMRAARGERLARHTVPDYLKVRPDGSYRP